ncbi:accessory gene regulator ArgB-like protein [Desnuesiella massiliensis]|uniref:accessory gene regulator ArgB-like protein n=1 Tax=Desnuesiella massiliensis TaxID=1650662 RepID=UPI0006E37149|nr:accessory gene regulator B family protein [Desnuesiella massiliensis]
MINTMAKNLSKKLVNLDIIKFDDYDVIIFGLEVILSTIFEILGLLILGFFLDSIMELIVFIGFFSLLRVNSGGYHASTCFRCFIISSVLSFSSILTFKNIAWLNNSLTLFLLIIVATVITIIYAPIDTPNKPFSKEDYVIYRKKSLLILSFEVLLIILFFVLNKEFIIYCNIAAASIFFQGITLILGKIQNKSLKE